MVISGSQEDCAESRFSHLIQPIKDLTKNWDVDIAAYLEDYLEELEHTVISFDGGATTMNFAQAAMLVQSSACVYSKKVEYLYSLVHQVLDMLANKKKQAQKTSVDDDGNDADADFNDNDADDDFLSLDDLPEGKNLYMKEDFDKREDFQLLPEMPLCLIPHDDGEKGENPLLSKKGEVLASRNDFKMNTCCIHSSGTLLLDMSHLILLHQSIQMQCDLQNRQTGECVSMDTDQLDDSIHSLPAVEEDPLEHSYHAPADMEDDVPPTDLSNSNEEVVGVELRRSERNRDKLTAVQITNRPQVDPWKEVDPHEETRKAKPATRKGRQYKLCPGLEDKSDKTKKRKRNKAAEEKTKLESIASYIERSEYSNIDKFPKNPLKVPTCREFERLYWLEYKKRQALNRLALKQKRQGAVVPVTEQDDDDEDGDDRENILPLPNVLDDDDGDDLVDDNLFNAIDNALNDSNGAGSAYRTFEERVGEGIVVDSYEDLVRKHVEEYMASAQKYAQITELSQRVAEWEDKIMPKLEEEEKHGSFDINRYGSSVIDNLDTSHTVRFRDMVSEKPVYEICRTFLASLMLANTTNILIEEKGVLEQGMDMFELKLLSRKRHFEELQEYMAPSLSQT
ncbi:condensin-2 complex subunit H2-like [Mya arenaria]|uniref:condensin-2 complex subunit H2-like n=1 Tax=Mya arenaria TaxID=6604 RepID=UPI0022E02125|nr:condensin-2 complex subunit H2-like [Mya arenaria]